MQTFISRCNLILTRCVPFFNLISNNVEKRLYYLWPVHTTITSPPYAYQNSSIRDIATINDICNLVLLVKEIDPLALPQEKEVLFKEIAKKTLEGYSECMRVKKFPKGWDGNIGDYGFLLMLGVTCRKVFPEVIPVGWEDMEIGLVNGICGQQRKDGSLTIFFDCRRDSGEEFYLPEAMIGLCSVLEYSPKWVTLAHQEKMEKCVTEAFKYVSNAKLRKSQHKAETFIFYSNWQFKWGLAWIKYLLKVEKRDKFAGALEHLESVLSTVKDTRFVSESFEKKATVEVACFCEGLVSLLHTKKLLKDPRDEEWLMTQIVKAVDFLEKVQEKASKGWKGGFVHTLGSNEARLDVTGHVANALSEIVVGQKNSALITETK